MSIPDTPYTRKEAYLNAIATGDSSGIPEMPYTREEMYLDAIAKGGGGGGGGDSSTLSGLTDVDISNPTDGQTLTYNATSGKWENGGSSGGGVLIAHLDEQTGALDKTYHELLAALDGDEIVKLSTEGYGELFLLTAAYGTDAEGYYVKFLDLASIADPAFEFYTNSESGYPVLNGDAS